MRKTKSTNKSKKFRAFSMIELSMVILIIGLLIAGILASRTIISKFRISTAQILTISSPVNGIPDSTIWLESSLEKSFKKNEQSDTVSITAWYDIRENVNKNNAAQVNSSLSPTYSNTINFIHAIKFDGTDDYLSIPDASFLNHSNYTIFVLEQRESNKSSNYFIGDSTSGSESATNQNLTLGYSADGTIKHSQSSDNNYTSSISTYALSKGKPRIFSFVNDRTLGKKTYINGLLAAESSNTDSLNGVTSLKIGSGYQGQIGEIIMFARALTAEERQSIEDYLSKKWTAPILRTIVNSCVGGSVSNTGCQLNCNVPATNGITTATVGDGNGTLSCNTAGNFRAASLPYSCSNGVFAFTGSPSSCSCNTEAGFSASGSTCVATYCTFNGTKGITNGTQVAIGTGTKTCGTDFVSGPINYTCTINGGSPTINSGSCYLQCTGTVGSSRTAVTISGVHYTLHKFTSSGTLNCPDAKTGNLLIVAGGGGGGGSLEAGGGGGGGVIQQSNASIASGDTSVIVGAGGVGGTEKADNNPGGKGGNSSFGTKIAIGGGGGGGGGGNSQCGSSGSIGGSGGGGGRSNSLICPIKTRPGGAGTSQQGFAGGASEQSGAGGGGGGAGAVGFNSLADYSGGGGGIGIETILDGINKVYYGGGGGGGAYVRGIYYGKAGGNGGGGEGGNGGVGSTGAPNTGGGGGGAGGSGAGKAGGSGIVVIRYSN